MNINLRRITKIQREASTQTSQVQHTLQGREAAVVEATIINVAAITNSAVDMVDMEEITSASREAAEAAATITKVVVAEATARVAVADAEAVSLESFMRTLMNALRNQLRITSTSNSTNLDKMMHQRNSLNRWSNNFKLTLQLQQWIHLRPKISQSMTSPTISSI